MLFLRLTILCHFNLKCQLYINLNALKEFDFDAYVYHSKSEINLTMSSLQEEIKSILFLSCFLFNAKTQYWSTELKVMNIVWIVKKIQHIIKITEHITIIYINYSAIIFIVQQFSLNTVNIKKLNLYLIWTSEHLQCFHLNVHYKSDKTNIILKVLFCLVSQDYQSELNKSSLDVLYTSTVFIYANNLVEISLKFC